MSTEIRKRRDGGRPRRSTAGALPQLPWETVRNPYPPMEILSADQLEAIHETSLRILEEQGIELMSARGRALLSKDARSPARTQIGAPERRQARAHGL